VAAPLQTPARVRKAWAIAVAVAALAAAAPFVHGILAGQVLYFRDLAVLFHPYRQYVVAGLRAGELRYWDPYVHEGVPLLYPPLAYPLDLLQALWADRRAVSTLLALHVPLGAAALVLLARRFGLPPMAAAAGGIVYALGGFLLSTLNLYIYVQAAAWAPVVVWALRGAGRHRTRGIAAAAAATALAVSTLGIELALQAVIVGLVLALRPRRIGRLAAAAAAAALGMGLAAPAVLVMRATMGAGERAHGFSTDVVLNQSVHPFTLVQVVAADVYGDLAHLPDRWWGSNFFDRGFPYILSLYLGATVLALAVTGAALDRRRSRRLVILALVALVVALGRYGGLEPVLGALPDSWRVFRYPTKAFFTMHLCVALLAAIGVRQLLRGRGWRVLLGATAALGAPLVLLLFAPLVARDATAWFVVHFFPPVMDAGARAAHFRHLVGDAAQGGGLALAAAAVAACVTMRRLSPAIGTSLVVAIAAADLLRAGGGLNPMRDARDLDSAPDVVARLHEPDVQRVFSCHVEASPAYWTARRASPERHETLSLAVWADTLAPHFNRAAGVRSALTEDLTSLVPLSRLLPADLGCASLARLRPRLRAAGVSHVLSLDPLRGDGYRPVGEFAPARIAPLHLFLYAVEEPVPLRYVAASVRRGETPPGEMSGPARAWIADAPAEVEGAAGSVRAVREEPGRLELDVEATRDTALVVTDGWAEGWRATVNAAPAAVLRAGHHRAVWVPAGRSSVVLAYRPPGLRAGLAVALASLLAIAVLARWRAGASSTRSARSAA
jgi:hypothetical protein